MASFCGAPGGFDDDGGLEPERGTGGPTFDKPACNRWLQRTQATGMLDWEALATALDEDIGEAVMDAAEKGYDGAIRDVRTGVAPMQEALLCVEKRDRVRAAFKRMRQVASEIMLDAVADNYARGREDEREAIVTYYAELFQRAPFSVADMLSDIRRNQHWKARDPQGRKG